MARKEDERKKFNTVKKVLDPKISGLGKGTTISYWSGIKKFFDVNEINNPDEYIVDLRRLERNERIDKSDEYEDNIKKFAISIKGIPSKTQNQYLASVKKFFAVNRIDFPSQVWNKIKIMNHIKKVRSLTLDKIPDQADLKAILSHGGLKEKALFMVNATSGTRIGEITSLTFDNLKFEENMLIIREDTAKGNYQRTTFITDEAKEVLQQWIIERKTYLKRKYIKSKYVREKLGKKGYTFKQDKPKKSTSKIDKQRTWKVYKDGKEVKIDDIIGLDDRVFPYTTTNARTMWNRMIEKAGHPYNEKDENQQFSRPRYKYHIHTLKKFWKTQLTSVAKEHKEFDHIHSMGAHESELGRIYSPTQVDDLKRTYFKYCDILNIFSDRYEMEKIIKPKMKEQDIAIASLVRENKDMEKQIKNLQRQYDRTIRVVQNQIMPEFHKMQDRINYIENQGDEHGEKAKIMEEQERGWIEKFPTQESQKKEIERLQALEKIYDERWKKTKK